GDGGRPRPGRLRPRVCVRTGARAVRPGDLVVPGDPFQARGHGHGDRSGSRARVQGRVAQGPGAAVRARGGDGEAVHRRALEPRGERSAADSRRGWVTWGGGGRPPPPPPQKPPRTTGGGRGGAGGPP